MKKLCLFLVTALGGLFSSAQNQPISDANAQQRQVSGFHAIEARDGIDIYLTQGNKEAVAVSAAKEEYRDKIVTRVENGVLKLYYEDRSFVLGWRSRKLRAYISVRQLDRLRASGGSDVIVKGTLRVSDLTMHLSGGSDFVGLVEAQGLSIDQSGGSDVHIKGKAVNLKVDASGGSDFKGYELQTEYAVIKASGGSDAQLSVSKEIYADANGGSDVHYKGSPDVKHSSSSGGGSVTKRD